MRILMLNHNVRGRGTYYRCMAYGRHLAKRGFAVDLMTISPRGARRFAIEAQGGVRVIETPDITFGPLRSGWDFWDTLRRIFRLRKAAYDIVHGFDGRPVVRYPARFLQRRGVPYVSDWADWWGHGGVINERRHALLNRLFAPIETYYEESCRLLADHNTVISAALAQRAAQLGVDPQRITQLPGGAEPDRVRPIDRAQARVRTGLQPTVPIVAYAGFVQYDIAFVLDAFARAARNDGRITLLLIGPRLPAGYLPGPVRDRVIQTGVLSQENALLHLAAADLLLLPFLPKQANLGRWPNKAGEYMCLAQPILTHAVGEVREIVEAGAAEAAPPHVEAFAQQMVNLLADPDRRAQLGRQARWSAEHRFDYATRVDILDRLYRRLG